MDVPYSPSSFCYGFTYDVFLSFRGSDTRYGFTGNLYKALCDKGIHTFIDDEEIQRGDEITASLAKSIETSRIAIIVFSENYVSSSFCLDELVTIIHCIKVKGRLVWPVFYDVDPSDVRHQRGSYGEALAKHEEKFKDNMEKVQNWRKVLQEAADMSGWHFKQWDGYEHVFIGKIVEEVSRKINRVPLLVADYPVGLESQVQNIISLLNVECDDRVHVVGVHGMGGIGKTTLALAVYNFIADNFEGFCFLENVRENSSKRGLVHLQKILLYEILGEKKIKLASVRQGISTIQHRLQKKKILLILDDVDHSQQLEALVGGFDRFGSGSRIIITTRDKHLLARHGINKMYELKKLNHKDALLLLSWKTFHTEKIDPSYMDVLNHVVTYASGLPLALVVIGSNMFGKSIEEWKSALDRYRRIPNKEIQRILKVSFDSLEQDEQGVFLDIACCFKGYHLAEVEDILHAHHSNSMKYQIGVLVEKSLIKLGFSGEVTLHDMIEDMGKEIVRQESAKEPGNRSRLWFHEDIVQVLENNSGTSKIEIINLDFSSHKNGEAAEAIVEWNGEVFKKMRNLRTLIIRNCQFSKGPEHLPNSLKVLEWQGYPSQHLPSDFHPKKLVICKLQNSCFTSLECAGLAKKFSNMRVLKLDCCQYLTHIHDVSSLQNLEEFSFSGCKNLITIDDSIGFLNKLKILNAVNCIKLGSFPPLKLASLEKLDLSGCLSLENFPEILGEMENIKYLHLQATAIEELPFSFQKLTQLKFLYLYNHGVAQLSSCIGMMPNLALISGVGLEGQLLLNQDNGDEKVTSMLSSNVEHLNLQDCNLSDEFLALGLMWFANVKELDLSASNFSVLPECIKNCCFLWKLVLNRCKCLREIRGIPPNVEYLYAGCCESMTPWSRCFLLNQELHEARHTEFLLPKTSIPEWFDFKIIGKSISFWFRSTLPAIVLCFICSSIQQDPGIMVTLNGQKYFRGPIYTNYFLVGHTILFNMKMEELNDSVALLENEWNHGMVTFEDMHIHHREIGIHVFKQKSGKDIRFTDPYRKRKSDCTIDLNSPPLLGKSRKPCSLNDVNTQITL
ncbi:TMV resistance protein N-like [Abrus precatorius]|uniref:TMV resistance protein N-like n=1 Tax=Abrus precatorius TaxID=3816 RepID=A0A8B8LSQ4_ABRPR|nr:TMV resistance protein N-like [Abrus precatorius]